MKPITVSTDHSIKASVALSYVPVLFAQLGPDHASMLAELLQAMRDGGYEDGFADGRRSQDLIHFSRTTHDSTPACGANIDDDCTLDVTTVSCPKCREWVARHKIADFVT